MKKFRFFAVISGQVERIDPDPLTQAAAFGLQSLQNQRLEVNALHPRSFSPRRSPGWRAAEVPRGHGVE